MIRFEVTILPEDDNNASVVQSRQARERIREMFRAQAIHLQKLEEALKELREGREQLELEASLQFETVKKLEFPSPPEALEAILAAVRNLSTAASPQQVLNTLTKEASLIGVRGVAFEVRGKAAWGVAACGFGPELTGEDLRSLVVLLSVDTPFRQVFETGEHVRGNSETLKKNRNLVIRLSPGSDASILLLPIRSRGAVSAVFYADSGGKGALLPESALRLLAEFAGAQLDRLMLLKGETPKPVGEGVGRELEPQAAPNPEPAAEVPELEERSSVEASLTRAPFASSGETSSPIVELPLSPLPEPQAAEGVAASGPPPAQASDALSAAPAPVESAPVPVPVMEARGAEVAPPAAAALDASWLCEGEQKIHKDAKRFAKLLVSEIELYNRAKVAEGRKNKDLYKRLKLDIERSRQTFDQRFGKTVGKQFDYFHEELVRTLAGNDPSLLGSDYPGHSV